MALSLLAKRSTAALRKAAAARTQRPVRMMSVRAFKEDKKQAKEEKDEQTTSAVEKHRGGGAVSPRREDALQTMPFRRMADAMNQMQREMDAMMGHFGLDLWDPFSTRAPATPFSSVFDMLGPLERAAAPSLTRLIPVEIEESDKAYTVHAEVPGFNKDDIKVTLDPANQLLTISASRNEEEKQEGAGSSKGTGKAEGSAPAAAAYSRRSSMSFTRSFSLPQDADLNGEWDATAAHGVLTLTIPKTHEAAKPAVKQIPIKEAK